MISNDLLFHMLCEFGSTALMIVFGVGVHCDTVLKGTKYQGSGHMFADRKSTRLNSSHP